MSFSALWQWKYGDEEGMQKFLLAHYVEHRQFTDKLLGQTPSFAAVDLPIQRIENWKDWLGAHQMMSQSVWTGIGGGQSTDFGTLDYESPTAVDDWQNIHQLWHAQVRSSLGL